jgi:TATA-binding protein-associated factor Taf7
VGVAPPLYTLKAKHFRRKAKTNLWLADRFVSALKSKIFSIYFNPFGKLL